MLRRENDRAQVFKIAKQITTTNRDIAGDKCVKDDGRGGGGGYVLVIRGSTCLGKRIARDC